MEQERDRIATLQRESESFKEFLLGISAEALEQPSTCERWTVADVLSHVGSQMFVLSITRGLAGDVSPPLGRPAVSEHNEDDFAEGIAQRAFATRAQQGDGLLAWFMGNLDESVKVFDSVEPDQWDTQCYWPPGPEPISTLLDMRIAELCMHAWDVRSVLEANYHLSEDSLRALMDTVPRAMRRAFRPEPGLESPVWYRFSMPIQRNAYLGELVMAQLGELLERTEDTLRAERIRNSLHAVSLRVQDLRAMEAVHSQFFVSIDMSRENNTRLGQSVERTLTLAINVVTVGLAIQVALVRQRRVLEATQKTREFLGNVILVNAAAIKQHTAEIGDVYNNPVVAIDKIAQAQNDLIEAMDTADRLKQEGIDAARENIAELRQLSSDLQRRASGLREQPALVEQSIEA